MTNTTKSFYSNSNPT